MRQLEVLGLGHIEQPANAECRIDHEPAERFNRLARFALKQEVHEDEGFGKIAERVAQARTQWPGHHLLVAHRRGAEDGVIDPLVDAEHRPVEAFERIALGVMVAFFSGLRRRDRRILPLCGDARTTGDADTGSAAPDTTGPAIALLPPASPARRNRRECQRRGNKQWRDQLFITSGSNRIHVRDQRTRAPRCRMEAKSERRVAIWLIALR
jgi:hypothetical protein